MKLYTKVLLLILCQVFVAINARHTHKKIKKSKITCPWSDGIPVSLDYFITPDRYANFFKTDDLCLDKKSGKIKYLGVESIMSKTSDFFSKTLVDALTSKTALYAVPPLWALVTGARYLYNALPLPSQNDEFDFKQLLCKKEVFSMVKETQSAFSIYLNTEDKVENTFILWGYYYVGNGGKLKQWYEDALKTCGGIKDKVFTRAHFSKRKRLH